jgi:hypothetical protein
MADGPTLAEYIETRFNLLIESVKLQASQHDAALLATVEASKLAAQAIRLAMEASQAATDLRYQQRFEAQSDALAAAFLSQQTAMQTAFTVAEKAVQAALAAADRAVSKAELAADKRFEALNELREMLTTALANLMTRAEAEQRFTAVSEKMEATAKHIDSVELRLNTIAGETAGGRHAKDDTRGLWAIGISIGALLLQLAFRLLGHG